MNHGQRSIHRIELLNIALVLVILCGGAYLRYIDLGVSLYDDEVNTRDRALQSAAYTLESRNYPLFYLSAKVALMLGDTEEFLRLPSFIAGLLSILAIYGLVRQLHSRTAGLLAAALLAVSPFHIVHSTFARYYALLMLFSILTVWFLYIVLRRGGWFAWIGYTVSTFLALASHVCFAPAVFGLNAGAAVYLLFDRSRGSVPRRIGAIILLGVCSAIAAGNLIYRDLNPAKVFNLAAQTVAGSPAADGAAPAAPEASELAGLPAVPEPALVVQEERPEGSGRMLTNPATGEVRYKLTVYDCIAYLKRFYWNYTFWMWPLLIAAVVWGIADLLLRRPAGGLPLVTGLLLSPVPLFFLSTSHWYHPRYLSYLFVFSLVLIAVGLCLIPRFFARVLASPRSIRLWRMSAQSGRAWDGVGVLYALSMLIVAGMLSPAIWKAYQTYPMDGYLPRSDVHVPGQRPPVNRTPARDYRASFQYMAETVRDGDPILYMMSRGEYAAKYARHYLPRFTGWKDEEVRLTEAFGAPTPARLRALASTYPMSNLWFYGYLRYDALAFGALFEDIGAHRVDFLQRNITKGLVVYHRGAPTVNHIRGGEFDDWAGGTLPEGVSRVTVGAYSGRIAARVRLRNDARDSGTKERFFSMPVSPAAYRLRNAGFEAWYEGLPVGWRRSGGAPEMLYKASGHESPVSLGIKPGPEPVVLQQRISVGLAPGRTLRLSAVALSDRVDNLHLVVRFQSPGFQEEHHVSHSGSGTWEPLELAVKVPVNADPGSITVELVRLEGGTGEALVDGLQVRVDDAGANLDPDTPYVVSLAVRTENLRLANGADRQPAGRVRLSWQDSQGEIGYLPLMKVYQDPEWRKLSAIFQPGVDLPDDLATLMLEVGIADGSGVLFIDQVQLEAGTQPTAYTSDERLPHDEALSGIDLEALAVPVAWGN